ncbi:carboxymuconolactone decarboxylase family protein [Nocardia sp. CA2R105]|uniref:carboxymuconolactone decarboxylase family protein n=1 Tax=Nocardia coffeae TaxID=2873381 RepID=UPI001CA7270B|nr:carboxymuconolactone decarboxylase family protein [Nocardia coffeae]MBY8859338.1 carboxymuconolactone decarboxylase family protein [Nocardia coffeae]
MTTPPRLAPLPPDRWDAHAREMLRGRVGLADRYLSGAPDAPPMPNVLGILGHHIELGAAWLAYNGALLDRPAIDPRYRELVILRVAWRSRARYEWTQHARLALDCGVTADQVEAVTRGPEDPVWSPVERLLLSASDQLLDGYRIEDETWAGLATHFDARQLIEVLFVAGSYLCLALVFNSVGLQPDPEMDHAPFAPPEIKEQP